MLHAIIPLLLLACAKPPPPEGPPAPVIDPAEPAVQAWVFTVMARVRRHWAVPAVVDDCDLRLDVSVDPERRVERTDIARSSGLPDLDLAAVRAIEQAAPLPPPPEALLVDGRADVRLRLTCR